MRVVFADTCYWISLMNPGDEWHARMRAVTQSLGPVAILTTDEVLTEFLNYHAAFAPQVRAAISVFARELLASPTTEVVSGGRGGLLRGLDLYQRRPDKGYSLTDCISMQLMRDRAVTEVLTHVTILPRRASRFCSRKLGCETLCGRIQ